ncbi:hypothetical protein QQP08_016859 [Theobroma cacao]|nr:hypothetical protein QQP08_016859 [Theobroma cacao]
MVADQKGKSDISLAGTFASSAFAACFAENHPELKRDDPSHRARLSSGTAIEVLQRDCIIICHPIDILKFGICQSQFLCLGCFLSCVFTYAFGSLGQHLGLNTKRQYFKTKQS